MSMLRQFWVGTKSQDASSGIWRFARAAGADWAQVPPVLMAPEPMPTFLAVHPLADRLYAVGEQEKGAVRSHKVATDCALRRTSSSSSGGAGPCHLLVHPQGQWLYVANYVDGTLGAIELTEAGDLGDEVLRYPHSGSGPVAGRQDGPHAHYCAISPGGDWLIVADLGTDQLRAYALDDGLPADEPVLTDLPAGFGPRHIAAWEEVLYVTGELSGEVAALAWDEGTGAGEVVTRAAVSTREGDRYPSHIERLGDWLIIGVRGVNTLSAMAITGNGTGLEALGEVTTVDWPRHLAVSGDYVLVAGEGADSIGVHPIEASGVGQVAEQIAVPAPMCILPM